MADINLPYGIDNFEMVRNNDCYYVDKTGFIKELLSENFGVNLVTRPRRFGKTLTMMMLSEFLDIRKDSKKMFEGLEISKDTGFCRKWMNQWPVLFLTLKDVIGNRFETAYGLLQDTVASLCKKHAYLGVSDQTDPDDRVCFRRLKAQKGTVTDIQCALRTLLRMMHAVYGKMVILIVDEYDVPLANASEYGYYEDMVEIIRSFLGMTWKTNDDLKFAVVTGCLRMEGIFKGANNFISSSVTGVKYQDYFGFQEWEVEEMLKAADLTWAFTEMKKCYDGYFFGEREVYCPWDVINHIRDLSLQPYADPRNHWVDTSHNDIIRRFVEHPHMNVGTKFETLLAGGIIEEPIREDLNYDIVHSTEDNLWSILYLTGYLTSAAPESQEERKMLPRGYMALRIPNEEVKSIFSDTVKEWFEAQVVQRDRSGLFQAWWSGDTDRLTQEVTDILFGTISYFDYKEDFYHAFVAGLFTGAGYDVQTNSEQGNGRADIVVREQKQRRAIVIEVKWTGVDRKGIHRIGGERCGRYESEDEGERDGICSLEAYCTKALQQIEEKQYKKNLLLEGYRTILCYGARPSMESNA